MQLDTVTYELLNDGAIARVTLNRPEARNAQNRQMTYDLDAAFSAAAQDPTVKVIILAGAGPHFSAGHDLKDFGEFELKPVGIGGNFSAPGAEGHLAFEEEVYLRMCRRWHDLPKPTIAQVQGKTIAGGLMLMWVCDLIIAADDALFSDPTTNFGVNGVEWFSHPYEFGIRKAKEMLFTGDFMSAEDALRVGMINHAVPESELADFTLAMAEKIAARPAFALQLAKMAVNQALDAQGFWTAQQAAFNLQHVGHSHTRESCTAKNSKKRGKRARRAEPETSGPTNDRNAAPEGDRHRVNRRYEMEQQVTPARPQTPERQKHGGGGAAQQRERGNLQQTRLAGPSGDIDHRPRTAGSGRRAAHGPKPRAGCATVSPRERRKNTTEIAASSTHPIASAPKIILASRHGT